GRCNGHSVRSHHYLRTEYSPCVPTPCWSSLRSPSSPPSPPLGPHATVRPLLLPLPWSPRTPRSDPHKPRATSRSHTGSKNVSATYAASTFATCIFASCAVRSR